MSSVGYVPLSSSPQVPQQYQVSLSSSSSSPAPLSMEGNLPLDGQPLVSPSSSSSSRDLLSMEEKHRSLDGQASVPPSQGETSLEDLIQKAETLMGNILEADQKANGIKHSYDFHKTLPGSWKRVEKTSLERLRQTNALIDEKQSFQEQQMGLIEAFAQFDSNHHVTCSQVNVKTRVFRDLMKDIDNGLKPNNKLSLLKAQYTELVTPVQPRPVVAQRRVEDDCCVIS